MAISLTPNDDDVSYATTNSPLEIYGLAGNDKISGGNNSDLVNGGEGNDILQDLGGLGNDHLVGEAGNDKLTAIAGNDWLEGGAGDDALDAGDGDDRLDGGSGDDFIDGEAGDDTLVAGSGTDLLFGGLGNDRLIADGSFADGDDTLSGGDGNDVYVLSGLNFSLADSAGQDRIEIALTFSLANHDAVEDLTLTGAAAIDGTGNNRANTITGNDAANVLDGGGGNDLIRGYGGSDRLIGGLGGGVEYLYGGTGNDTFVVMDIDDTPVEFSGEGSDTVLSSIRWVLGNNVENLVLTGTAGVNGFGNALGNNLTGNIGNNYLQGFAGYDILAGGAGNDTYELGDLTRVSQIAGFQYDNVIEGANAGIDTVSVTSAGNPDIFSTSGYTLGANVENGIVAGAFAFNLAGNLLDNSLAGNGAANRLIGNDGDDTLDGKAGLDTLVGGKGDDVYVLNDLTFIDAQSGFEYDAVVEAANGGIDTVFVSQQGNSRYYLDANIENALVIAAAALDVIGNELGNVLIGNGAHNQLFGQGGNDTLRGGGGADELLGGAGNDTYILDDAYLLNGSYLWDTVAEEAGAGIDTVHASSTVGRLTYVLGANVENAVARGEANFNLVGNTLNNALTGNAAVNTLTGKEGNDVLDGKGGADRMSGDLGNDTFRVDNAADKVFEVAGQGTDTVLASVTYALAAGQSVEVFATTSVAGTGAIHLTGNELAQTINGNNGNNGINGGGGADTLSGLGGHDMLTGGLGNDVLTGGLGFDNFVFNTALGATNVDKITDFNVAQDTIRLDNAVMAQLGVTLGGLSAAKFWSSATGAAHDADDRIVYETDTGKLFYDANGNAAGGAIHFATLTANLALASTDFVVF